MTLGETLPVRLTGFDAENENPSAKEDILAAMAVYGLLVYFDGKLCIPNHEVRFQFQLAMSSPDLGAS